MDYTAEIIVKKDAENLRKCITLEKISRERSSLEIEKKGKALIIRAKAKDAVALRATVNAVTQAIAVYSKMNDVSRGKK